MNHLMIGLNGPLGYIFSISKDYIKMFAYNEKAAFHNPLSSCPINEGFLSQIICLLGGPFYPQTWWSILPLWL